MYGPGQRAEACCRVGFFELLVAFKCCLRFFVHAFCSCFQLCFCLRLLLSCLVFIDRLAISVGYIISIDIQEYIEAMTALPHVTRSAGTILQCVFSPACVRSLSS